MKPTYHYTIMFLLITASLTYADKKNPQDDLAVLKKRMTDTTNQTKKEDPAEQLVNCLQCTEMSKEQQIAAVHLFEKNVIRKYNTWWLKQFFNGLVEAAAFSSKFSPVLTSVVPKIIANDLLVERVANGDSTQKDLEFVEKAFATYEDFGIVERIVIAEFFQDLRDK